MLKKISRILSLVLCFSLILEQSGFAQVAAQLDIASHLSSLRNSFVQDKFRPLHLRYLQYNPQDNNFRLLLDKGDTKNPTSTELEASTKELLNYFLVGLSLPNDSFWVNLRPDSPDNIIDPLVAQTEVGKILLEADLQLKKDTSRMTSPETPEGKDYWNKLYEKTGELFGSENITIPTLTRPWIVPDEIIVRESLDSAYIYKATLKVMLEQDYLKDSTVYSFKDERLKALNEYSSQLIRETIIPKLTKEVNTSKRYAPLRQIFYSLILAQWFKARQQGKGNPYSQRIDSKDLSNLLAQAPYSVDTYFKAYKDNFEKGEYNIKETAYTPYGQVIRSYFSGGITVLPSDTPYADALIVPLGEQSKAAPLIPTSLPTGTPREDEVEAEAETGPTGELRQVKVSDSTTPSSGEQKLTTRRHFLRDIGLGAAALVSGGSNLLSAEGKSQTEINVRKLLELGRSKKAITEADLAGIQESDILNLGLILNEKTLYENIYPNAGNKIAVLKVLEAFFHNRVGRGKGSGFLLDSMYMWGSALDDRDAQVRKAALGVLEEAVWKLGEDHPSKRFLSAIVSRAEDFMQGTISFKRLKAIYGNVDFRIKTDTLSLANQFSIARAIDYNLARFNLPLEENGSSIFNSRISKILSFVLKVREAYAARAVVDQDTTIIIGLHEDFGIDAKTISEMLKPILVLKPGEKIEDRVKVFIGAKDKENLRKAIQWAPLNTALWLSGHGGDNHPLWFTKGKIGSEISNNLTRPEAYSFQELADDVSVNSNYRGSAGGLKIIIDSCKSATSITDFYNSLYLRKNIRGSLPLVITASEADVTAKADGSSNASVLLKGLKDSLIVGYKNVLVWNFYKAEEKIYDSQDVSFFLPVEQSEFDGLFKDLGIAQKGWELRQLDMVIFRGSNRLRGRSSLLLPDIPVLSGLMGRWHYESAEFNPEENHLTLKQATRIPTKDGVVEEEFLISGENLPRTITLQTRELTEQERIRVNRLRAELGHGMVEYRVLLRDEESIMHRIYGFAVDGVAFIREDILSEGNDEQVKEALDHEARELTDKEHDVIREEQYQGGLRGLITHLSNRDKMNRGVNVAERENAWDDMKVGYNGKGIEGGKTPPAAAPTEKIESSRDDTNKDGKGIEERQGLDEQTPERFPAFEEMAQWLSSSEYVKLGKIGRIKLTSEKVDILKFGESYVMVTEEEGVVAVREDTAEHLRRLTNEGKISWSEERYLQMGENCFEIARLVAEKLGYEFSSEMRKLQTVLFQGNYSSDSSLVDAVVCKVTGSFDVHVYIEAGGIKYNFTAASEEDFTVIGRIPLKPLSKSNMPSDASGLAVSPSTQKIRRNLSGIDGSTALTIDSPKDNLGGINFCNLPIVTQAISNLHVGLSGASLTRLQNVNLSVEWQEIDRLVNSGITPSTERIKEFVQVAAIQDEPNSDMGKIVSCIADIFRLEEERCESSDPVLKDILIVLESGRSTRELKEVFVGHNI